MKKTLVLTFPLALGVPGGGTEGIIQLAKQWARQNVTVVLLPVQTQYIHGWRRPPFLDEFRGMAITNELIAIGVQVMPVRRNPISYLLDGLGVLKMIKRLHREMGVDAVMSWHQEGAYLSAWLKKNKIVFAMVAAAPSYTDFPGRRVGRWLRKTLIVGALKKTDAVFTLSNYTRQNVLTAIEGSSVDVYTFYQGINPVFADVVRESGGEMAHFLFFGRLIRSKGIYDLLTVLGRLARNNIRDWTLRVAGPGEIATLKKFAEKQGIGNNVDFLAELSHAQLAEELAWADLGIFPTYIESFGLAIAEAQAAGLPVIAYNVGAVSEVVEHEGAGWLVKKGDLDALEDAVLTAIANPEKFFAMGLRGRENVMQRFSWGSSAKIIYDVLEKLFQEN